MSNYIWDDQAQAWKPLRAHGKYQERIFPPNARGRRWSTYTDEYGHVYEGFYEPDGSYVAVPSIFQQGVFSQVRHEQYQSQLAQKQKYHAGPIEKAIGTVGCLFILFCISIPFWMVAPHIALGVIGIILLLWMLCKASEQWDNDQRRIIREELERDRNRR